MASGDKQYIADKETLDAIKALIGLINDTGGTAAAGTLMAKVNTAINYVLTNNSGSSTGNLSQKLSYIISTLLGTTGATGGSATAGTLSAKANKIINDVASIISKIDSNGGIIPYTQELHEINRNLKIITIPWTDVTTSTKTVLNITGKGIVRYFNYAMKKELEDLMLLDLIVDGVKYDFARKTGDWSYFDGSMNFGYYSRENTDIAIYKTANSTVFTAPQLMFKNSLKLQIKKLSSTASYPTSGSVASINYSLA